MTDAHYTSATLIAEIARLREINRDLLKAVKDVAPFLYEGEEYPARVAARIRLGAAIVKAEA